MRYLNIYGNFKLMGIHFHPGGITAVIIQHPIEFVEYVHAKLSNGF